MKENRVVDFYKKIGFYNEDLFMKIKQNTTIIDNYLSDFCGVYIKEDGSFKLILPKIKNEFDELIWVHEYAHIIFWDMGEILPNIMESFFVNMFISDKEEIIRKTEEEINNSDSTIHILGKKIKLLNIRSML